MKRFLCLPAVAWSAGRPPRTPEAGGQAAEAADPSPCCRPPRGMVCAMPWRHRRTAPQPTRYGQEEKNNKWFVAILLAFSVAIVVQPVLLRAAGPDPQFTLGQARAEITLPTPEWYAVIRGPGESATIYKRGEAIFKPEDVTPSLRVRTVSATALVVQDPATGKTDTVSPGSPLPGLPGLLFERAVALNHLTYRYQMVDRVSRPDPLLVALHGLQAVLHIEVSRWFSFPAPASPPIGAEASPRQQDGAPDPTILTKMRVTERDPHTYEVNAADMQALLDNADRVAFELLPKVRPFFSIENGLGYRLTGPPGEGTLTSEGFTITSLRMANRIGLEAGDRVLRINGHPVDGFASAFRIYYDIRRDPNLSTISVDLVRRGSPLTKVYRIR